VLGLSASVEYEGEAIASVVVPQLLPPVLLPPLWSGVVDRRPPPSSSSEREQRRLTLRAANRRFPVELDAPIAKLQAPLGRPSPTGVLVSWPLIKNWRVVRRCWAASRLGPSPSRCAPTSRCARAT